MLACAGGEFGGWSLFVKEGKLRPGDKVEIGAVLRPFKGERVTRTITLELMGSAGRMTAVLLQAMGADFKKVLDKFKVPEREQKELFAIVETTKGDIVISPVGKKR